MDQSQTIYPGHVGQVWVDKKADELNKVVCVFPMIFVFILPNAEFGPNDHRDDSLHFIILLSISK